ncbi:phosphate acyltransferase, partial [Photorhabdus bodei]|uniref:phosphate acyltransferase n=1 Tax=Photorhabdus bodei TaxID=2029681 RepID=UPI001E493FB2
FLKKLFHNYTLLPTSPCWPILQGIRKPVNDLSRGALVDDIIYTVVLTVIQSVQGEA